MKLKKAMDNDIESIGDFVKQLLNGDCEPNSSHLEIIYPKIVKLNKQYVQRLQLIASLQKRLSDEKNMLLEEKGRLDALIDVAVETKFPNAKNGEGRM